MPSPSQLHHLTGPRFQVEKLHNVTLPEIAFMVTD